MKNRLILVFIFFSGQKLYAATDQLLIKRSSRPAMAEATIEALRPWETPTEGFFVRSHHHSLPAKIDSSWNIIFDGLIMKPRKITVKSLLEMPQVSFHAILECSGNGRSLFSPSVSGIQWKRGAIGNAEWTGVPIKEIFKSLVIKPTAKYVTFEGADEPVIPSQAKFVRSIPMSLLLETNSILALKMNREPLTVAHGGPVRLIMPTIYGQNWVKWVNKITFAAEPDERNFAQKAYRMPIESVKPGESWDPVKSGRPIEYIKVQTIFTDPKPQENINPGAFTLKGKTFSGSGPVSKVEISIDSGNSWSQAKLSPSKDYAWQEFEMQINVQEGVNYEALARATDVKGNTQPLIQEWNPKGYLYNAVDRVVFKGDSQGAHIAEGADLVKQHCLTCHSVEIIDRQTLDKAAWISTVKKMSDYGLVLDKDTTEKIAKTLSSKDKGRSILGDDSNFVDLSANPDLEVTYQHRAGNAKSGYKLFISYCAACHGQDGNGKSAPKLKGRRITESTFWTTVKNGRRLMPGFTATLSTSELENIRAWIQK